METLPPVARGAWQDDPVRLTWGWPGLALIMLAAVAARAWLLFSTPYVPGVNGAYYLIQARALLERGTLGLPDLPLTFCLHAALAWLLATLGRIPRSDAIILAVKLCDATLPVLAALPVFVLLRQWATGLGRGDAVPLAAAALSVLALPWLMIVGELQKNSLALVFLASLPLLLRDWLETPTRKQGMALLACLAPLGLAHIGVLGAALVLMVATLVAFALRRGRLLSLRNHLPWIVAGLFILGFTSALVAWKFDQSRIVRLITALTDPGRFATEGKQIPEPPGGVSILNRWLPFLCFTAAVLPALAIAWKRRSQMKDADLALVTGGAFTVLAMTGPWFGTDKELRLSLIAFLPAIILLSFALLHIDRAGLRRAILAATLILVGATGITFILPGGKAVLEADAMDELKGLAPLIGNPRTTTIVTEHGAEWWSAWFLAVHVAQIDTIRLEDWSKGETLLFLEVKSGRTVPLGSGRAPQLLGERPASSADKAPPSDKASPGARPPLIPPSAEVLHDGPALRLVRVAMPPAFLPSEREAQRH